MTVSDGHIRQLIDQNRILKLNSRDLDEAEAQAIALGVRVKQLTKGAVSSTRFHFVGAFAERIGFGNSKTPSIKYVLTAQEQLTFISQARRRRGSAATY